MGIGVVGRKRAKTSFAPTDWICGAWFDYREVTTSLTTKFPAPSWMVMVT